MKMLTFVVLMCAAGATLMTKVRADDVEFAQPGPVGGDAQALIPRLSDIMFNVQMRHEKLWYGGVNANWPLAGFELQQLRDAFGNAGMLYRNIPVETIRLAASPINDLQSAIQSKDERRFVNGFKRLTLGCNSCHVAAGIGFIEIRTPTASTFSNQVFQPQKH